jgi:cytochrome P450/NADPH-cytochrome P450 reductase
MASGNPARSISHPPNKPVVGNTFSVDAKTPIQSLSKKAQELAPIFWLDMMGAPVVFVSGFDLVNELCDEKRFDVAVPGSLRRTRGISGIRR